MNEQKTFFHRFWKGIALLVIGTAALFGAQLFSSHTALGEGINTIPQINHGGGGGGAWGSIVGTLSDQADLQTVLDGKASATGTAGQVRYFDTSGNDYSDAQFSRDSVSGQTNIGRTWNNPDISGAFYLLDITDLTLIGSIMSNTNPLIDQQSFMGTGYDNGFTEQVSSSMAFISNLTGDVAQMGVNSRGAGMGYSNQNTGATYRASLAGDGFNVYDDTGGMGLDYMQILFGTQEIDIGSATDPIATNIFSMVKPGALAGIQVGPSVGPGAQGIGFSYDNASGGGDFSNVLAVGDLTAAGLSDNASILIAANNLTGEQSAIISNDDNLIFTIDDGTGKGGNATIGQAVGAYGWSDPANSRGAYLITQSSEMRLDWTDGVNQSVFVVKTDITAKTLGNFNVADLSSNLAFFSSVANWSAGMGDLNGQLGGAGATFMVNNTPGEIDVSAPLLFDIASPQSVFHGTVQNKQGTDITAANGIVLPEGNSFVVKGTTDIYTIDATGLQNGTQIVLYFQSTGGKVVHDDGTGGYAKIHLDGATDLNVIDGCMITLVLMEGEWRQVGPASFTGT